MGFDIYALIEVTWLLIPALAANGLAPLARGRRPVDGGRLWGGKPILGKGKTWEGTVLGVVAASLVGGFMAFMRPGVPFEASAVALTIVPMGFGLGALLGLGAMAGDIVESLFKRRAGIARGEPLLVLDQADFVLGALLFAALAMAIRLEWVVWALLWIPVLHYGANGISFAIGMKSRPW